jgi:simple sugar transport system permease protein
VDIPAQIVGTLPYIVTIVVLAGFIGRSTPPAAVGVPYEK